MQPSQQSPFLILGLAVESRWGGMAECNQFSFTREIPEIPRTDTMPPTDPKAPIVEPNVGETYNIAAMFRTLIQKVNHQQVEIEALQRQVRLLAEREPAPKRRQLAKVTDQYTARSG